jgi:cystathionine beta-lyase family protein involved in aluminum resistance
MGYKSRWLSFRKAKGAEVEKPGVEDSTRSDATATTIVCSSLEFDSDESPQRSRTQTTITGGFTVQHTSHTSQVAIKAIFAALDF